MTCRFRVSPLALVDDSPALPVMRYMFKVTSLRVFYRFLIRRRCPEVIVGAGLEQFRESPTTLSSGRRNPQPPTHLILS